jgi:hypothetical protein
VSENWPKKRGVRSPKNIARLRSELLDILILLVRLRSEKLDVLISKLDLLKNQVRLRSVLDQVLTTSHLVKRDSSLTHKDSSLLEKGPRKDSSHLFADSSQHYKASEQSLQLSPSEDCWKMQRKKPRLASAKLKTSIKEQGPSCRSRNQGFYMSDIFVFLFGFIYKQILMFLLHITSRTRTE